MFGHFTTLCMKRLKYDSKEKRSKYSLILELSLKVKRYLNEISFQSHPFRHHTFVASSMHLSLPTTHIRDEVIKNGPTKSYERQLLKNFICFILEYFVSFIILYVNGFLMFNLYYLLGKVYGVSMPTFHYTQTSSFYSFDTKSRETEKNIHQCFSFFSNTTRLWMFLMFP